MRSVPFAELDQFLSEQDIQAAASTSSIGRQLTYRAAPRRTVVVHFAMREPLEYVRSVIGRILDLSEEWLLLTRYGSISDLGLLRATPDQGAISFTDTERQNLAEFLCTRPMAPGSAAADLYVLAGNGATLMTWDHHTATEGLELQLKSVTDTSRLLVTLNELGAELELFYNAG